MKIYGKKKRQKFPDSETYYPFIWEELPYPEQIDFSKYYIIISLELRFIESVTTTGYVGNNPGGSVFNYLHLFYMSLMFHRRLIKKYKWMLSLRKKF